MIIYPYNERIWRTIITPNFVYNIYDHEWILSMENSEYTYTINNNFISAEQK